MATPNTAPTQKPPTTTKLTKTKLTKTTKAATTTQRQSVPRKAAQDVLARFSAATRAWFTGAFAAPTPAQTQAWDAISSGAHTLVVAPTGSGKTLSAFLWSLDRLFRERLSRAAGTASSDSSAVPAADKPTCRVLYISPLKALAVDVERNLRSPLVGIEQAAARLGQSVPPISVATRSGDTPPAERRAFATRPSDILITTPESLFLLLTSAARESLRGVETVIVDEIHAVAGTKRGAHLAVSLARLDELLPQPAQRIGLSATVRPVEAVADFLAGGRDVTIVQPEADKSWDLQVHVPVPDLGELGGSPAAPTAAAADWSPTSEPDPTRRASIWPHVEERIVDLVAAHRSTLVFVNSRRLAERLTARLNELWEERLEAAQQDPEDVGDGSGGPPAVSGTPRGSAPPAQMLGSGVSHGAPGVLARAHHGSVSKEARAAIEDDLKSGRLPAVVATSSLELGIDMGAVDLVIQVESPPSVAGALQRVGRAGHQVGATSRGIFFPKFRGDLVQTSVVVERMREGQIEAIHPPRNPLDVLAQQVVAMCAVDDWSVEELLRVLRSASPYATLSRAVLDSVLDMLAGRYPSEEFAELRPRIVWDRVSDTISGRPGALRLAVTSGGTIPDRGLYGVFLAGGGGPGRRVGELDEEMVYESRVGDVFTLGTSSWRIEDITHDQVLVTPAPGAPGRLPFWKGDTLGRGSELGAAVGRFVGQLSTLPPEQARTRITEAGLDEWAADNLLGYLAEQREATGRVPDDTHLILERFRDELGDWRIVLHSPFGAQVHAPWALCISTRMQERFGFDVQAMHGDDGIVLRLPDVEFDDDPDRDWAADVAEAILPSSEEVTELVTSQVAGSALFASRFRECAARSLLLPRRQPGRRQALWQQRQRAMQLLSVASNYPTFPVVLEAVRECVQDVYDVPGLKDLLARIEQGAISVTHLQTESASPFARSLMFGYVAQFLYEGDSPLAERRAAALSLDPGLLAELLGTDGSHVRDLLDPQAVLDIETELQCLSPERRARHAEDVSDLLRRLGPLSAAEVAARTRDDVAEQVPDWLAGLQSARRIIEVRIAGEQRWASVEDAGRLRDALGVALPVGIPEVFLDGGADPLRDLLARHAATRGPFTLSQAATRFGIGEAVARASLDALVTAGRLSHGPLRPLELRAEGDHGQDYSDAQVLRRLKRRSLAALRAELEPVAPEEFARFLPTWQGIPGRLRGVDGLYEAIEQLAGARVPASALETLVLPQRVRDYAPHLLDELLTSGDVCWQGHGLIPGGDLWVSLHPTATAHLTLSPPSADLEIGDAHGVLLDALDGGGSYFTQTLTQRLLEHGTPAEARPLLWDLVAGGRVTGDSFAAVRALLATSAGAHRSRKAAPHGRRIGGRLGGRLGGGRLGMSRSGAGLGALGSLAPSSSLGQNAAISAAPSAAETSASETSPSETTTPATTTPKTTTPESREMPGLGMPPEAARSPESITPRDRSTTPETTSAAVSIAGTTPGARARLPRGRGGDAMGRGTPMPGRWSLLPTPVDDPTTRAVATAEILLGRHGVVTRGAAVGEEVEGGFSAVYRVLSRAEDSGRVRRGYLVEGLGAAQFAAPAAIDALRAVRSPDGGPTSSVEAGGFPSAGSLDGRGGVGGSSAAAISPWGGAPTPAHATPAGGADADTLVLAATDPANPYGAALPWPATPGRPGSPNDDHHDQSTGSSSAHGTAKPSRTHDATIPGADGASTSVDPAPRRSTAATRHRPGRKAGSLVVLHRGHLVLYLERGGRTLLTWSQDPDVLGAAAQTLAGFVRRGAIGVLTVQRIDGEKALGSTHPVATALTEAGFHTSPTGFRLRR